MEGEVVLLHRICWSFISLLYIAVCLLRVLDSAILSGEQCGGLEVDRRVHRRWYGRWKKDCRCSVAM